MKFITFCTQWSTKDTEEGRKLLAEHADRPFSEFLEQMGVGKTLQSFIINTIGILQQRPTAMTVNMRKLLFFRKKSEFLKKLKMKKKSKIFFFARNLLQFFSKYY